MQQGNEPALYREGYKRPAACILKCGITETSPGKEFHGIWHWKERQLYLKH